MPDTPKPICFVAQPFRDPFQGRFDQELAPAIEAAGMTAYKVDNDPAADVLIDDIHRGIEGAAVVLVDITENNPNVWYELGYSQALHKPLVMISCSTEREPGKPYPFDVRGRRVLEYAAKKRSDLDNLREEVTKRITALMDREAGKSKGVPGTPPAAATPTAVGTNGFTTMDPRTRAALVAIVGLSTRPGEGVTPERVAREMSGYTQIDVNIATRVLERSGLIERGWDDGEWGPFAVVRLSPAGEDFVVENHIHFETQFPSDMTPV